MTTTPASAEPPAAYYHVGQRVAIVATPSEPCCDPPRTGIVRSAEWRQDNEHEASWWYGIALDPDAEAANSNIAASGNQGFRGLGWKFVAFTRLVWAQGWQLSRVGR